MKPITKEEIKLLKNYIRYWTDENLTYEEDEALDERLFNKGEQIAKAIKKLLSERSLK